MSTKKAEINRLQLAEPNGEVAKVERVTITPPKMMAVPIHIKGTAPMVQNRFAAKAMQQMKSKMEAGSQARKGTKREPRNFADDYEQAKHVSTEGWLGISAVAFRAGCVSACRLVGFKMTLAKLAISIKPDGFDRVDGTPLVRITKGEPRHVEHYVRNDGGSTDIRSRPLWDIGWEAVVTVEFDAEVFSVSDIVNLFARVGAQVGVGAGRPDSRQSVGMCWGTFEVLPE